MTPNAKLCCIDGTDRNFYGAQNVVAYFLSLMMHDSSPVNLNFARRPPIVGKWRSLPDVRDSSWQAITSAVARVPILAAGGIVLRQEETPLIAVVRLRKRNEWVLPKGKLDDGETPRIAAEREAIEETGHAVFVHEFLGTLVYESGGRSKVVHYWRMEANGEQVYDLMDDVKAF